MVVLSATKTNQFFVGQLSNFPPNVVKSEKLLLLMKIKNNISQEFWVILVVERFLNKDRAPRPWAASSYKSMFLLTVVDTFWQWPRVTLMSQSRRTAIALGCHTLLLSESDWDRLCLCNVWTSEYTLAFVWQIMEMLKKTYDRLNDISGFLETCSNSYLAAEKYFQWAMWGSTGLKDSAAFYPCWATEGRITKGLQSPLPQINPGEVGDCLVTVFLLSVCSQLVVFTHQTDILVNWLTNASVCNLVSAKN